MSHVCSRPTLYRHRVVTSRDPPNTQSIVHSCVGAAQRRQKTFPSASIFRPLPQRRHACAAAHGRSHRALGSGEGECDSSGDRKAELILYSKPGCHLCEGLEEKLRETMASGVLRSVRELVVRDISTNTEWWRAYQLEVPVMALVLESGEKQLQRQSPRLSAERVGLAVQKEIETLLGGHASHASAAAGGGQSGSGGEPWSLQPVDWNKKK